MQESSKSPVVGAAPEGASDPHSAARAVREMFTSIAPRYDLLNHVLSFNIDRMWWRRTARTFRDILARPDARILDLCCGTGDMTFALSRQAGKSSLQILGADFSHAMLQRAAGKSSSTRNQLNTRLDRSRCPQSSVSERSLRSGDFGFRFPQSRRLRRRTKRDRPCATSGRGVRHPRLRRTQRRNGYALSHLFQASLAPCRNHDLRRPRPLCLSSRLGRAFPVARRNAPEDETRRSCGSHVDALHVRNRGPVSRKETHVATAASAVRFRGPKAEARNSLPSVPQQFTQRLNVFRADISHHKIPQPILLPVLHIKR